MPNFTSPLFIDPSRLLNPLNNPNISMNQPPQVNNDQIATPEMIARLRSSLMSPPRPYQYGSRGRNIVASIAGGAAGFSSRNPMEGIQAADYIKNYPYREAYQDWLNRTGAMEKGVTLDTGITRARNAGLTSLAAITNALGRNDPELQGKIAGARENVKTTPNEKEFKFLESLPEDEQKAFQSYVDKKRAAIERNTTVHLSVKDAREQNIPLVDRDGKPIDTSKLPDNMEYRMFLGGPNGPYFAPDTQSTRNVTQGNVTRVIPNLTPTEPITEGEAITPTFSEKKGIDAQGNPVNEELQTRRAITPTTNITPSQPNQPIIPPVQPPGPQSSIPQNRPIQQPPVVPGQPQPPVQPGIVPPQQPKIQSQGQVVPPAPSNNQRPGVRQSTVFNPSTIAQYNRYKIPASAAMSQLLGTPNNPDAENLTDFAYLFDNPDSKRKIGTAIRLISDGLNSSGESDANIGASVMGYGVSANTGGAWEWFKNNTGMTARMEAAKAKVIDDAVAALGPPGAPERRFVDKLFATWGALAGFRTTLGQSGYKWANEQMRKETSAPGFSGANDSKEYINKLANLAGEANEGLRNARIPLSLLPEQVYWDTKTKELTKMGLGQIPIPGKKTRYTFEKIK